MMVYSTQEDPPEIREKLEALQSQNILIEELQIRLNTAQSERERLEKEIDEYRMSGQSYIRKCPKEILMIVFKFYTLANPRVVRRLLLVCREWYQLVVSMPRLWNRIPIEIHYGWDVRSSCKDISRRVEVCFQRSGSLPLELDLDFTYFQSSRAKICEKILDSFQSSIVDFHAFNEWTDALSTEDIEGLEVLPICHPQHVIALVEQLTGKGGAVMQRWGSFRITLPEDSDLAFMIWEHLDYPTPHLSHMDLIGTYEPLKLYKDDYFHAFSDLGALRHLEIDGLYELASFGIGVSSLESFVLRWVHEDISSLSGFTNLHTLKLVGETNRRLLGSREPVQQTTLSLPRLKSLYMQWLIRGIQDVQFNTPKLECLDILCRYSQLRGKANYAKVQTEHVSWRVENDWKAIDTNKKITFELQSILLAYPDTSYFTFPSIFKEMVVELLQEPIIDSPLSAALRAVTFEGPSGDRETLMVEELW